MRPGGGHGVGGRLGSLLLLKGQSCELDQIALWRKLAADYVGSALLAAVVIGSGIAALNDLDLSYTPPRGSPWDAVQMAAQAWVRDHQLSAQRQALART